MIRGIIRLVAGLLLVNLIVAQQEILQTNPQEIQSLYGQIESQDNVFPVDGVFSRSRIIPEQGNLRWQHQVRINRNHINSGIKIERGSTEEAWQVRRFAISGKYHNLNLFVGHLLINTGQGLVFGRSYGRYNSTRHTRTVTKNDARFDLNFAGTTGDDLVGGMITTNIGQWTFSSHAAQKNSNFTGSVSSVFHLGEDNIGILTAVDGQQAQSSGFGSLFFNFNPGVLSTTGELSWNKKGRSMILNVFRSQKSFIWILHYRDISPQWQPITGSPISTLHSGKNEKTIALAAKFRYGKFFISSRLEIFSEKVNLNGYLPNSGYEWNLEYEHFFPSVGTVSGKYRIQEKNSIQTWIYGVLENTSFSPETRENLTVLWVTASNFLKYKWQHSKVHAEHQNIESGNLFSITCHPTIGRELRGVVGINIWGTDGWSSRIYHYSPGLAGEFRVPAYSGFGTELFSKWNYELSRQTDVSLRHSITWKSDKSSILYSFAIQLETGF